MSFDKSEMAAAAVAPAVDEMVREHWGLVGHLVQQRLATVPVHVTRDDLMSAGLLALVTSAHAYEAGRGVPFASFAGARIRGALLDELRGMDWATRSVRARSRSVDAAHSQLTASLGQPPTPDQVATALGVEVGELVGLRSDLARANLVSLDGTSRPGGKVVPEASDGPEALLLLREKLGYLHGAIAELPERMRLVVVGYYFEERLMTDIGAALGVTESRVSQLRAEAMDLLRDGMNSQLDPLIAAHPRRSRRATAARDAYCGAIADNGSLASRLARSTTGGDMLRQAG